MSFIECENLVKIYKIAELEVVALQGLDLVIEKGEMIALVGPSGSGKSTLMNVLGGLDVPSAGKVHVGLYDLMEMKRRQQTARNLLPYLSARENIEMPMAFNRIGSKTRKQRAEHLLEQVGLSETANNRPSQLSGGEQQRVALAVA